MIGILIIILVNLIIYIYELDLQVQSLNRELLNLLTSVEAGNVEIIRLKEQQALNVNLKKGFISENTMFNFHHISYNPKLFVIASIGVGMIIYCLVTFDFVTSSVYFTSLANDTCKRLNRSNTNSWNMSEHIKKLSADNEAFCNVTADKLDKSLETLININTKLTSKTISTVSNVDPTGSVCEIINNFTSIV